MSSPFHLRRHVGSFLNTLAGADKPAAPPLGQRPIKAAKKPFAPVNAGNLAKRQRQQVNQMAYHFSTPADLRNLPAEVSAQDFARTGPLGPEGFNQPAYIQPTLAELKGAARNLYPDRDSPDGTALRDAMTLRAYVKSFQDNDRIPHDKEMLSLKWMANDMARQLRPTAAASEAAKLARDTERYETKTNRLNASIDKIYAAPDNSFVIPAQERLVHRVNLAAGRTLDTAYITSMHGQFLRRLDRIEELMDQPAAEPTAAPSRSQRSGVQLIDGHIRRTSGADGALPAPSVPPGRGPGMTHFQHLALQRCARLEAEGKFSQALTEIGHLLDAEQALPEQHRSAARTLKQLRQMQERLTLKVWNKTAHAQALKSVQAGMVKQLAGLEADGKFQQALDVLKPFLAAEEALPPAHRIPNNLLDPLRARQDHLQLQIAIETVVDSNFRRLKHQQKYDQGIDLLSAVLNPNRTIRKSHRFSDFLLKKFSAQRDLHLGMRTEMQAVLRNSILRQLAPLEQAGDYRKAITVLRHLLDHKRPLRELNWFSPLLESELEQKIKVYESTLALQAASLKRKAGRSDPQDIPQTSRITAQLLREIDEALSAIGADMAAARKHLKNVVLPLQESANGPLSSRAASLDAGTGAIAALQPGRAAAAALTSSLKPGFSPYSVGDPLPALASTESVASTTSTASTWHEAAWDRLQQAYMAGWAERNSPLPTPDGSVYESELEVEPLATGAGRKPAQSAVFWQQIQEQLAPFRSLSRSPVSSPAGSEYEPELEVAPLASARANRGGFVPKLLVTSPTFPLAAGSPAPSSSAGSFSSIAPSELLSVAPAQKKSKRLSWSRITERNLKLFSTGAARFQGRRQPDTGSAAPSASGGNTPYARQKQRLSAGSASSLGTSSTANSINPENMLDKLDAMVMAAQARAPLSTSPLSRSLSPSLGRIDALQVNKPLRGPSASTTSVNSATSSADSQNPGRIEILKVVLGMKRAGDYSKAVREIREFQQVLIDHPHVQLPPGLAEQLDGLLLESTILARIDVLQRAGMYRTIEQEIAAFDELLQQQPGTPLPEGFITTMQLIDLENQLAIQVAEGRLSRPVTPDSMVLPAPAAGPAATASSYNLTETSSRLYEETDKLIAEGKFNEAIGLFIEMIHACRDNQHVANADALVRMYTVSLDETLFLAEDAEKRAQLAAAAASQEAGRQNSSQLNGWERRPV